MNKVVMIGLRPGIPVTKRDMGFAGTMYEIIRGQVSILAPLEVDVEFFIKGSAEKINPKEE